jgi:acyl carrier protein
MTSEQITARVREIIVEQLGVDEDQVTREATLVEDLGCDSLDRVELALACEEEFGITIPDDETERMTIVAHLLDYLAVHAK